MKFGVRTRASSKFNAHFLRTLLKIVSTEIISI